MVVLNRAGKSKVELACLSQLRQLLNEKYFMSGSLVCRHHTCGKKHCRCMRDSKYRHFSWYIGRSIKGKMYMKYIPHEQIKEIREWIRCYQLARKLLRKLGEASWRQIGKRVIKNNV